jgi:hypothetical protein
VKFRTAGLIYATLAKEYLEAMRLWGGRETFAGIQIIRDQKPAGVSVRDLR